MKNILNVTKNTSIMLYKLLGVHTEKELNIGDYIQALASAQFLPLINGFVQRENLKEYDGADAKIIMNGWYMLRPENWPPSSKIHPLFVAFHINSLAINSLLCKDSIEYLKKYEPIGCRDFYTMDLLKGRGLDAYFSGCMTLTLGYKYKNQNKTSNIYFVDPYFDIKKNLKTLFENLWYLISHYKTINTISKKFPSQRKGFRKLIKLVSFYKQYKTVFSKEMLLGAKYINQQSPKWKKICPTDEIALEKAEELVKMYASAKFVVTSRIHCALPCLGLETPVIFTENINQSVASSCRLDGLKELFNIIECDGNFLKPKFKIEGIISDKNNIPANKDGGKLLSDKLIKTCLSFVNRR